MATLPNARVVSSSNLSAAVPLARTSTSAGEFQRAADAMVQRQHEVVRLTSEELQLATRLIAGRLAAQDARGTSQVLPGLSLREIEEARKLASRLR